jgi:tripartite ATP-independent transporter DctM subunit
MSEYTVGMIGVAILILFLFSRMPIGFVLILVGFLGFSLIGGLKSGLGLLMTVPYQTGSFYPFAVIPLFLFMGELAGGSGQSENLYRAIYKCIGPIRGGLAISTVAACAAFGAVSGSSIATAAIFGTISLPEMRRYGYDLKLAVGTVASGGTLAILIPPSLSFLLYGLLTGESIGKLFIAGFIPGIILATLLSAYIYTRCRLNPTLGPPGPSTSFKDKLISVKNTWVTALLFLVVIGGIWLGFFTPNEAAAIGALGSFIHFLFSGRFSWSKTFTALSSAVKASSMIFLIMIGATFFSYFLTITKMPMDMTNSVSKLGLSPYIVLIALTIIYLFLGCILDSAGIIILTIPIVYPLIKTLGFNPIWFGVYFTVLIEIGLITPPVGLNVYVLAGVSDIPMETIFRGIIPFFFIFLIFLLLLIIFPNMALWLPSMM